MLSTWLTAGRCGNSGLHARLSTGVFNGTGHALVTLYATCSPPVEQSVLAPAYRLSKKVKVAHTRVKRTGYIGSCYDALGIRHSLPSVILAVRMTHVGLGDVQTQLAFLQKSKLFSQKLH